MLKIPFWPDRTRGSRIRLAALTVLLLLTAELFRELSAFDPGSVYLRTLTRLLGASLAHGALQDSPPTSGMGHMGDPNYEFSALELVPISLACKRFFQSHERIPLSLNFLHQACL